MFSAITHKSLLSVRMDRKSTKLLMLFSLMALGNCEFSQENIESTLVNSTTPRHEPTILNKHSMDIKNSEESTKYSSDMEEFKHVAIEYIEDVLNREKINIAPGVYIQKVVTNTSNDKIEKKSFDENTSRNLIQTIKEFSETHALRVDLARAMSETGRLFFFKGKS